MMKSMLTADSFLMGRLRAVVVGVCGVVVAAAACAIL